MQTSSLISQLHNRLTKQIEELDQRLIAEFDPSIKKIDQLRYDAFRQCVMKTHDNSACYKQSTVYEMKPNFQKVGSKLEQCVDAAAGSKNWQKLGDKCMSTYEMDLRKEMDNEIKRVLNHISK